MLKMKLIYTAWASIYAFGIYGLTIFIYTNATGVLPVALNIALIKTFIIVEKIEHHYLDIWERQNIPLNKAQKALQYYMKGPSFKSAMYFFYMFVLIAIMLQTAAPLEIDILPYTYVQTVYYGILLLIAGDKFMHQIIRDIKANKASKNKRSRKKWKKHLT